MESSPNWVDNTTDKSAGLACQRVMRSLRTGTMLQRGPGSTVILPTTTIVFRFATSPHDEFVLGLCNVA